LEEGEPRQGIGVRLRARGGRREGFDREPGAGRLQSSVRRTHARLGAAGSKGNVGLRQQIEAFQLKSGLGGCVCPLPCSEQAGVSCPLPAAFGIRPGLLGGVLEDRTR